MFYPFFLLYRVVVIWVFHMELHWALNIGRELRVYHGFGFVNHPNTIIGSRVTLRHGGTLGNNGKTDQAPVLEDGVDIGADAQIIGPVRIGRDAIIGAGSVVTKDVPPATMAAGNPARVVRTTCENA